MFAFAEYISWIGDVSVMFFATLIVIVAFAYYKKWHFLFVTLGSVALTAFITYTLKIALHVPRPITALVIEDGYRFPSGHAAMAAIIGCVAVYVVFRTHTSQYVRILVTLLALTWYVTVSWVRLYLGVHYIVDVVAGLAIAIASFLFIYNLEKRVSKKFRQKRGQI